MTQLHTFHQLGAYLQDSAYDFPPRSVIDIKRACREGKPSASVEEDLFGWGMEVDRDRIPEQLLQMMGVAEGARLVKSPVRAARIGGLLCLHTSGPGAAADAVFLGPDTSRYLDVLEQELGNNAKPRSIVEVGCGSGAAAIWLARRYPDARVVATDVNPAALEFTRLNASLAGVSNIEICRSDVLADVDGTFDLVACNPPFIADAEQRTYRHGGSHFGMELPARIIREGVKRLAGRGRLLMYTASPMRGGKHVISELLADIPHEVKVIGSGQFDDLLGSDGYDGVDDIATIVLAYNAA